jgi:broad specificity polyphosphatase/5'/3'-nucleotidase SurE
MVIEKEDRLILLTNDDGLYAAGLRTLLEVMEEFGNVIVRYVAGTHGQDSTACKAA